MDGEDPDWSASPMRTTVGRVRASDSSTPSANLRGLRYNSGTSAFRYVETPPSDESTEPTFTRALLTPGPLFVPGEDEQKDVQRTISKYDFRPTDTDHRTIQPPKNTDFDHIEEKAPMHDDFLLSDSLIYPNARPSRSHRYSNGDLETGDLKPTSFGYLGRQRGPGSIVSSSLESWNSAEFNIFAEAPDNDVNRVEKTADLAEYYGGFDGIANDIFAAEHDHRGSSGRPLHRKLPVESIFLESDETVSTQVHRRTETKPGLSVNHWNPELRLSHPSFGKSSLRPRGDIPLSNSYDHLPGSGTGRHLRRAQLTDSPVRQSTRRLGDKKTELRTSSDSSNRVKVTRRNNTAAESTFSKFAFKEFMQQYETRLKLDPHSAQTFAEETIGQMQENSRWRAYLELAENAKKYCDFALVSGFHLIVITEVNGN